jgi:pimeloyl-ACP methyl ester carboxylesterase
MPYTTNEGAQIYWEEQGTGEPLLLIMGLGYSLDMWHRTRDVLAQHYRALLFDNRGVGRSDVPPPPYSIPQMASDALAVMNAAGVARAHVFGVSMGGLIAQEFTLQNPGCVQSLILGCTFCGGPHGVPADQAVLAQLMKIPQMSVDEGFAAMVPFIYHPSTPRERIAEALELRRQHFPRPQGFMGQVMAIGGYESYSRLARITAPTLVIHGDADILVPPANGRLLAENIPGATLEMIPAASHIFLADQPELSHAAILTFLGRNGPADAHPLPADTKIEA